MGFMSSRLVAAALAPAVLFGALPAGADLVLRNIPASRPVETVPPCPAIPENGVTGSGAVSRDRDLTRAEIGRAHV